MQKSLSLNQDQSLTEMTNFQNYAKNPIWDVMLQLRAGSKVVVKIL